MMFELFHLIKLNEFLNIFAETEETDAKVTVESVRGTKKINNYGHTARSLKTIISPKALPKRKNKYFGEPTGFPVIEE